MHIPFKSLPDSAKTACFLTLAFFCLYFFCAIPAKAGDPFDFLIQKVCIDAKGNVLPADPYFPPAGSSLRNLRIGENLPYYKHDQPTPGHPNGYQRHDSYPMLDKDGNEIVLNPFYFRNNSPGNGFDIYMIRDPWASAGETQDGGGFSTTFFGKSAGAVTPYNGWVFFPSNFPTENSKPGSVEIPITGRYWEQNGETWHGVTPAKLAAGSETSWRLIKNCRFGGVNKCPVKQMDAIQSVHGYISKGDPQYDYNMAKGHLEIFYFTQLYGATRWEVWTPIAQLNDYNRPSDLRTKAIRAATGNARPIPEAGERSIQPADLPNTPKNQFSAAIYTGEDGIPNMYAITDVRDWSAVTVLDSPQPPPPCPNPLQNLLANFHFDTGSFQPWQASGNGAKINSIKWNLCQSHAPLDMQYAQNGPNGGVRYLAFNSPDAPKSGRQIYQDIPAKNLKDGIYTLCLKLRSESGNGIMRMLLQQVDGHGAVLSTDIDITSPVGPMNENFIYNGANDTRPNASVYLSSTLITGSARVAIRPETSVLRFSMQPQTSTAFDIIAADVSRSPDAASGAP